MTPKVLHRGVEPRNPREFWSYSPIPSRWKPRKCVEGPVFPTEPSWRSHGSGDAPFGRIAGYGRVVQKTDLISGHWCARALRRRFGVNSIAGCVTPCAPSVRCASAVSGTAAIIVPAKHASASSEWPRSYFNALHAEVACMRTASSDCVTINAGQSFRIK